MSEKNEFEKAFQNEYGCESWNSPEGHTAKQWASWAFNRAADLIKERKGLICHCTEEFCPRVENIQQAILKEAERLLGGNP